MEVARDGSFMLTIGSGELARGLRPTSRSPRNEKFLTKCVGAVGIDEVLSALNNIGLYRIDTGIITDGFPYPQIFVFSDHIVVCGESVIYELIGGVLVNQLMLAPAEIGIPWSAVDFYDYIYMSNGKVAVRRRPTDGGWEVTTDLPIASGIVNFNGQLMIGAPDVEWT